MVNKIGFIAGIILIVIAAILFLGNFLGDSSLPLFLGLIGIVAIGASMRKNIAEDKKLKKIKELGYISTFLGALLIGVTIIWIYPASQSATPYGEKLASTLYIWLVGPYLFLLGLVFLLYVRKKEKR